MILSNSTLSTFDNLMPWLQMVYHHGSTCAKEDLFALYGLALKASLFKKIENPELQLLIERVEKVAASQTYDPKLATMTRALCATYNVSIPPPVFSRCYSPENFYQDAPRDVPSPIFFLSPAQNESNSLANSSVNNPKEVCSYAEAGSSESLNSSEAEQDQRIASSPNTDGYTLI